MNFQQILGREKADGRLVTEKETQPRIHRKKDLSSEKWGGRLNLELNLLYGIPVSELRPKVENET